ncbi:MAG: hypothetical protein WC869_00220 [Phycisphaerae bacterium]|jgi:dCTP deaminase
MIVCGNTIKQCIECGKIEVYRGKPEARLSLADLTVGPNSVDVTLGNEMLEAVIDGDYLDPRDQLSVRHRPVDPFFGLNGKAFRVEPGKVYLGYAAERFVVTDTLPVLLQEPRRVNRSDLGDIVVFEHAYLPVVQMLDGRSTVGRIGITVHVTAGFGDVGFGGNFTLEIVNMNSRDVLLYPGMRIGQIAFHCVTQSVAQQMVYDGAYKNDHIGRPVPPVLGPHRF